LQQQQQAHQQQQQQPLHFVQFDPQKVKLGAKMQMTGYLQTRTSGYISPEKGEIVVQNR